MPSQKNQFIKEVFEQIIILDQPFNDNFFEMNKHVSSVLKDITKNRRIKFNYDRF